MSDYGRGRDGGRGGRGRDGGRGRGGRTHSSPGDGGRGRGGSGSGRSGGRGGGAVNTAGGSSSGNARPMYQTPAVEISSVTSDVQNLSLQASSSSATPVKQQPAAPLVRAEQPPQQPPSSSKNIRPPRRPGYGSSGKKCIVRANHFLVTVADRDLHHYDVTITPEVLSKKVCRDIMKQLYDDYKMSHLDNRRLAYDGRKGVYTAGTLPFESKEFIVKLIDNAGETKREREFKVSIKYAAKADIHHLKQFLQGLQLDCPQETIQALDVVLRAPPSSAKYEVVGRSFFHPTLGETSLLTEGLECWRGYFQSLRPSQMGLSLNIDMSSRAFYESIYVSDYVSKFLNLSDLNRGLYDRDRVKVKGVLKGVKVEVRHQSIRRYRISGLTAQPVRELMFSIDGTVTSVEDYFRKKYNIRLKYPMLPAIQAGSDAKPTYLPMELCKIVSGQRYTKKLNGRQVTEMLKATCQRPSEREAIIGKIVDNTNKNDDADKMMKEFGIEVRNELTTIEARVLQPPTLQYHASGKESRVNPRIGQWNMIDKKMAEGANVDLWTCVNFSRNDPTRFLEGLIKMCRDKGMVFNYDPLVPVRSAHANQIERTLVEIHKESTSKLENMGHKLNHLQLLIVILPEASGHYGKIKRVCETDLGIVSQCCQPKAAYRPNPQYFENIALKINVKVGGRNCVLEQAVCRRIPFLTDRPTIIFGADVTHPQPGEDSSPSIAAVVASMDWPEVTKYMGLVSAQPHREEIIQELYKTHEDSKKGIVHGGMIRELLRAFFRCTGSKPDRIIFYRDGVSEGQFNQVLLEEMTAIRKACQSLQADYLPRVTFVVVQKRHHTRLFPANHNDRNMTDRSGNILAGTVVDTKICHPTEFDFYLCSHAGIKGTSRPAHYHVLYDENGFTADAMQNLTNSLCYTYARCTRSVSIVPPAYYAHLAAFRARYYIEDEVSDIGSTSGGGGATRDQTAAVVRQLPPVKANVKEVMFYV